MSQVASQQHPAAVLRSRYVQTRALLVFAAIAVVSLTIAVVILATNDSGATRASSGQPLSVPAQALPGQRSDGGPDESAVAAAIGSRAPLTPSAERVVPSSGASARQATQHPDESRVAAAISGR